MLGIDGELNSCKSLMLARLTPLYCGSSFSSWIGALVGEPRLPMVGGELGPESGVLLLQSNRVGEEKNQYFTLPRKGSLEGENGLGQLAQRLNFFRHRQVN